MALGNSEIRQKLMEVISRFQNPEFENYLQSESVLRETAKELNITADMEEGYTLLDIFYGLFRSGHLEWGKNIRAHSPPWFHVTKIGKKALQDYSHDPVNQEGYLEYVKIEANLNPIAESYLREAVKTFCTDCNKAAAVMVGGASESIILELRDTLVNKLKSQGVSIPKTLNDWRIKTILDSIGKELEKHKSKMPQKINETFDSFWSAFTGQIRMVRNDAGHPKNVNPITKEFVHSSLLIFPQLAKLTNELKQWINSPAF